MSTTIDKPTQEFWLTKSQFNTRYNAGTLSLGVYHITDDKFAVIITGSTSPTTATEGDVGYIYINTTDNSIYICVTVANSTYTWSKIPSIVNNLSSTSTTDGLSANMGKNLQEQINNVASRGRFLSSWDCSTGLPTTYPTPSSYPYTYTYKTGDYYIVSTIAGYTHTISMSGNDYNSNPYTVSFSILNSVSSAYSSVSDIIDALENAGHTAHSGTCPATGTITDHETSEVRTLGYVASDTTNALLLQDSTTAMIGSVLAGATGQTISDTVTGGTTNYKPNGSSISKADASSSWVIGSTTESISVGVNDTYLYDGTNWIYQKNHIDGSTYVTNVNYDSSTKKIQKTINGVTSDVVQLADVATSGSYDDLEDAPTVPTKTSELTNDSNFVNLTQLETRQVKIDASHKVGEAFLSWGGTNITGDVTPLDASVFPDIAGNKLAYINADAISVEYSTDAGSTWVDYGATDQQKIELVTTDNGTALYCGAGDTTTYANNRLRVTITGRVYGTFNNSIYCDIKKFLIYNSTNGASGVKVNVEYKTVGDYADGNDTWTSIGTFTLLGWSGWNSIPWTTGTEKLFGAPNSTGTTYRKQTAQVRFTFSQTGGSNNFRLTKLKLIGTANYYVQRNLAAGGHIYSFDYLQNATFPAKVTATQFVRSGGTSSQFLKADGSVDSNTYLTSHQDISGKANLTGGNTFTGGQTFNNGITTSTIAINGSFTALNSIGGGFQISDTSNVGIELGRRDGTAGTPYLDFHTDGTASGTDYNSRIIAEDNKLTLSASDGVYVNNSKVVIASNFSLSGSTLTITI